MQVYQNISKKHHWGFIDKENNYNTIRSAELRQIFRHYKNAIAIQLELLEYLERRKSNIIKIYISDFEEKGFFAIAKVSEFRQIALEEFGYAAIFNYDDKYGSQIRMPMDRFSRLFK